MVWPCELTRVAPSPVFAPLTVAEAASAVLRGGDDAFVLVLPPLPQPAITSATSGTAAPARRVMGLLRIMLAPSVGTTWSLRAARLSSASGRLFCLPPAMQRRVGYTACGRGGPAPRPRVEVLNARAVRGEEDDEQDNGGGLEHDRQCDRGSVAVLLEAEQAA